MKGDARGPSLQPRVERAGARAGQDKRTEGRRGGTSGPSRTRAAPPPRTTGRGKPPSGQAAERGGSGLAPSAPRSRAGSLSPTTAGGSDRRRDRQPPPEPRARPPGRTAGRPPPAEVPERRAGPTAPPAPPAARPFLPPSQDGGVPIPAAENPSPRQRASERPPRPGAGPIEALGAPLAGLPSGSVRGRGSFGCGVGSPRPALPVSERGAGRPRGSL